MFKNALCLVLALAPLSFCCFVAGHYSIVGYDPAELEFEEGYKNLFKVWLAKHERSYKNHHESELRYKIFKDNLKFIHDHNKHANDNQNYWLGLNKFADLTHVEFKKRYINSKFRRSSTRTPKKHFRYAELETPESVDWQEKGAVTPVKDQGACGSCWAFSTVGSIEGLHQIVTHTLVPLSEQELVDCDTKFNQGCSGGLMDYAFEFVIGNGGIDTEEDYPYTGTEGTCIQDKLNAHVVTIDSFEDVPQSDEDSLKKAVAAQPVAVAIEAGGREFQFYSFGVFNGTCGTDLDHGVLTVGYGTDVAGKEYWIVKNSWGTSWGENGFIRLERKIPSTTGKCGIAMEASFPSKKSFTPSHIVSISPSLTSSQ